MLTRYSLARRPILTVSLPALQIPIGYQSPITVSHLPLTFACLLVGNLETALARQTTLCPLEKGLLRDVASGRFGRSRRLDDLPG